MVYRKMSNFASQPNFATVGLIVAKVLIVILIVYHYQW